MELLLEISRDQPIHSPVSASFGKLDSNSYPSMANAKFSPDYLLFLYACKYCCSQGKVFQHTPMTNCLPREVILAWLQLVFVHFYKSNELNASWFDYDTQEAQFKNHNIFFWTFSIALKYSITNNLSKYSVLLAVIFLFLTISCLD